MKKTTLTRSRALSEKVLRAILLYLTENDGSARRAEVVEWLAENIEFEGWEAAPTGRQGTPRWHSALWSTTGAVAVDFMTKDSGLWSITDAGRQALGLGDVELMTACAEAHQLPPEASYGAQAGTGRGPDPGAPARGGNPQARRRRSPVLADAA